MQIPHPKISKIGNDRPAAVPTLWNKTYDEIDENFASLVNFLTKNTAIRLFVGDAKRINEQNTLDTLLPKDSVHVGDPVFGPEGKLYQVKKVTENVYELEDLSKFFVARATESESGLTSFATSSEIEVGEERNKAVSPAAVKSFLNSQGYRKLPPGTLIQIATRATQAPEGFLFVDGSEVLIEEFPTLDTLGWIPHDSTGKFLKLPNWDGRCGQTTNTANLVGTTIEDSLPTIIGRICVEKFGYGDIVSIQQGAFRAATGEGHPETGGASILPGRNLALSFNASLSNAKYVATSNKVQPSVYLYRTLIAY